MEAPSNANILLGVSGGIAAYKSAELVRRLRDGGAVVRVVMTRSAQAFITPLALQAVSGHPVHRDVLDEAAEAAMGHIELARWADLVLMAPATAHLMARVAHGLADDLLTTICLATQAPLAMAPAMNQQMWQATATQANVATLQARGVLMYGPEAGDQACGEVGPGRMMDPVRLARLVTGGVASDAAGTETAASGAALGEGHAPLAGLRVLLTAGPTREAIDPVRYISNHSSGKMGYAMATAARELGAEVTLVSGPTALAAPAGVTRVTVSSAAEMHAAVMARAEVADLFIAAAAVADYAPVSTAEQKLKKNDDTMRLELGRTVDILAAVAALADAPFTVGFAAETHDVEAYARAKLRAKGLDMIAANQVGAGQGFDVDENALSVFWDDGRANIPFAHKRDVARALMALVVERFRSSPAGRRAGPAPRAAPRVEGSG